MSEPTISEAVERFRNAYERDRKFTDAASPADTGGPALAAALLYSARNDGESILNALDAAVEES
jgi:hypothetical protein